MKKVSIFLSTVFIALCFFFIPKYEAYEENMVVEVQVLGKQSPNVLMVSYEGVKGQIQSYSLYRYFQEGDKCGFVIYTEHKNIFGHTLSTSFHVEK